MTRAGLFVAGIVLAGVAVGLVTTRGVRVAAARKQAEIARGQDRRIRAQMARSQADQRACRRGFDLVAPKLLRIAPSYDVRTWPGHASLVFRTRPEREALARAAGLPAALSADQVVVRLEACDRPRAQPGAMRGDPKRRDAERAGWAMYARRVGRALRMEVIVIAPRDESRTPPLVDRIAVEIAPWLDSLDQEAFAETLRERNDPPRPR